MVNRTLNKGISVIFTALIIGLLAMLGPAQAVNVELSNPNNANPGEDVSFTVIVDLNSPDQYLPVKYADVVFNGPNGFEETCRVYNDGSYSGCDLDLDVSVDFPAYEEGHRVGLDNGYGYYFGYGYGYGYGYGQDQEIVYNIIWHTSSDVDAGDYSVEVRVFAQGDDSYDTSVVADGRFTYCGVMEGMIREWNYLQSNSFDSSLDQNNDSAINLVDIVMFSQNSSADSITYGKYREFIRVQSEGLVLNEQIDINGDGKYDLTDTVLFAQNMNDENWCQARIADKTEANSHYFESGSKSFSIVEEEEENDDGSSSNGGTRSIGRFTGKTIVVENPAEEESEDNTQNGEADSDVNQESQNGNQTGVLSAITGAVAGLGSAIGLGSTISYILAMLILIVLIVLVSKIFSKKKN